MSTKGKIDKKIAKKTKKFTKLDELLNDNEVFYGVVHVCMSVSQESTFQEKNYQITEKMHENF